MPTSIDRPVFDVANDNAPVRLLDDRIIKTDTDDTPSGAAVGKRVGELAAARARIATGIAERAEAHRTRIAARQAIGDPDVPATDNQAWPLLESLRRETRHEWIDVVVGYRGLAAICAAQPLQGVDYTKGAGVGPEWRISKMKGVAEIDAAAEAGWPDEQVPGGEIVRKEVRQARGGTWSHTPRRAVAANDESRVPSRPMGMKFSEQVLIAAIDGRPILQEIREDCWSVMDAFEDAVLGGLTYGEIGLMRGFRGKQAEASGKALVHQGIAAVEASWIRIRDRERRAVRRTTATRLAARRDLAA